MSTFEVLVSGRVIGRSELESAEPGERIALGRFLPTEDYAFLKPIFRMWAEAMKRTPQDDRLLARYFDAVSKLAFTVLSDAGEVIPTEWVHISDYEEELGTLEISMAISDPLIFEQLFVK